MDKPRKPSKSKRRAIAGSASWLALVAATSLGVPYAETVRAEVKLPRANVSPEGRYRLIVQSYDKRGHLTAIPTSMRPRASAQRTVTAGELMRGIRIDLIELGQRPPSKRDDSVVVAWLEPGDTDLEFDARGARPAPGSFFGASSQASSTERAVEIVLERPRTV